MKRIIIDTDTGCDDAVAMLMALLDPGIKVEAITTVCGNVPLDVATKNALLMVELAGKEQPPVYTGAERPLFRDLVTAAAVHGSDGLGEMHLPHPPIQPTAGYAAVAILDLVKRYPGEIEIVTLGPVTNIAAALFLDPAAMAGVKHIYSMGTNGFTGSGSTPAAEFNVYVDAESYDRMLRSGIPITIIGIDQCLGEAAMDEEEIEEITACGTEAGRFTIRCNRTRMEFAQKRFGKKRLALPDAVAMAAAIWPELVLDAPHCYCYTCTKEAQAYGQVIIDDRRLRAITDYEGITEPPNALVVRTMDYKGYKQRLAELLKNA